jgi:hypothetical protein
MFLYYFENIIDKRLILYLKYFFNYKVKFMFIYYLKGKVLKLFITKKKSSGLVSKNRNITPE